ncbi:MAG: GNAT family N-acetyltransferase [Pseudomonadota bacterium]
MNDKIRCIQIGPDNLDLLLSASGDIFDNPVKPEQAKAFVDDPGHLLILATDGQQNVGFVSAVINFHPDKYPILFISEVGVVDSHQRHGIATQMMKAMFSLGKAKGCQGCWVATEAENSPARGLYKSLDGREIADIVVYDWGDSGEP